MVRLLRAEFLIFIPDLGIYHTRSFLFEIWVSFVLALHTQSQQICCLKCMKTQSIGDSFG